MESAHRGPNERQLWYFVDDLPGEYRLYKNICHLHDSPRKGILHNDSEGGDEDDGFERIKVSGRPGMPLCVPALEDRFEYQALGLPDALGEIARRS